MREFDSDLIQQSTTILRFGHEKEISAALSQLADVRVIWGGDQSVRTIRSFELPPHATELCFPDRFSYAALDSASFVALSETERLAVAESFYNDAYWFDQMGCSSPRVIFWRGSGDSSVEAQSLFLPALQQVIASKEYVVETGVAINKMLFA